MASRLGMRGSEPLGNTGLTAVFNIEHRFFLDTGDTAGGAQYTLQGETATSGNAANNKFWNGIAMVGVNSGFGQVTIGRQYTPIFYAMYFPDWTLNAGYNNWASPTGNVGMGITLGTQSVFYGAIRADNSVLYTSPTIGGLTVYGMYAFGENYRTGDSKYANGDQIGSGDIWGLSGVWRLGNLMVTGGYHKHDSNPSSTFLSATGAALTTTIKDVWAATIGYNFGAFGLSAGYTQMNLKTLSAGYLAPDVTTYFLSGYAKIGPGRLYVNAQQLNLNNANPAALKGGDGIQYGVTYMWELSNRTGLYIGVGGNDFSPLQSPTRLTTIDNAMRYQIGVNHKF